MIWYAATTYKAITSMIANSCGSRTGSLRALGDDRVSCTRHHGVRGKEHVAAGCAQDGTLVLHTLFFADEVRDPKEIGHRRPNCATPSCLARRLVDELCVEEFNPTKSRRLPGAARTGGA
jgi:hypothetical protein